MDFPYQVNGQVADADLINDMASAISDHDAILAESAMRLHGTGKLLATAATKATSASTADIAVNDYTLAADIPAGRIVEFVARLRVQSTVAGDLALVRLRLNSTGGTILGEKRLPIGAAATPYEHEMSFPHRVTSAGNQTYLLTVQRLTGSGTVTVTTAGTPQLGIFFARDIALETRFTIV